MLSVAVLRTVRRSRETTLQRRTQLERRLLAGEALRAIDTDPVINRTRELAGRMGDELGTVMRMLTSDQNPARGQQGTHGGR